MKHTPNLFKRGGIWYYRFMYAGKLYRGSTGTSDLRKAKEVLLTKQTEVRDGVDISASAKMTVGEWLDTNPHFNSKKKQVSVDRDKRALDRMRREWQHRLMKDIRLQDCERLMALRKAEKVKLSTLERDRVVWRAAFERAVDNDVIGKNPWKKVATLAKLLNPRDRVLTASEEIVLRVCLVDEWMRRFVTVALGTGLRVGELVSLRPMDVRGGEVHVRAEVSKNGKGRSVGVRPEVADALALQHPGAPDLCYFAWPTQAIRERLAEASREAGIPRVYPHALRRTFATRCAEKGLPLVMLQKLLGHSSPVLTAQVYVGIESQVRTDALLALNL